jgi:DNA repair protein RadA/Sms
MPKSKKTTIFVCEECGNESQTWQGQCRACGAWNSYKEFKAENISEEISSQGLFESKPKLLKDINLSAQNRVLTGINEFDSTLGGGFVSGQVILLGGNPGIGKSTLIMQIADKYKGSVLYASGEESESQVGLRAGRLGVSNKELEIISTNNVESVLNILNHGLLIIDSIQTMVVPSISSSAGSLNQIRECTFRLITAAKTRNIPVIIIGHITKEGMIAGPKLLEHMVDTVLYLEGEKTSMFRMLRVHKNRFGDDSDVGLFEMKSSGMEGVKDPYIFMAKDPQNITSGNAVCIIIEGKRPLAIEVQALVTKSSFGYPKRTANGFSINRLQLLCAVLEKKAGVNLSDQDVYLNIASGLHVKEPGVDLAVCAAIISSFRDKPLKNKTVFFGEVGLSGEVRPVIAEDRRLKECSNLGFENSVYSKNARNINILQSFLML